ncbi:MAG: lipopolysaccharide assembly protein LapA domain-containing protein [Hyphomicrobiaceae bacterium]
MRWFNTAVIIVLAAATLLFAVQNFQTVTVSFLNTNVSAPLALLIAVVYILGMLTGGSLWALIRWALEDTKGSQKH